MSTWRLTEVIDHENDVLDKDNRGTPTIKSSVWFTPYNRTEFEKGRPLVKALGEAWEEYMMRIENSSDWIANLEHRFGYGITPEKGRKLMTLFMWLGTSNGSSIVTETFRRRHALLVDIDVVLKKKGILLQDRKKFEQTLIELSQQDDGLVLPDSNCYTTKSRISFNYGHGFKIELWGRFYSQFYEGALDLSSWFENVFGTTITQADEELIRKLLAFVCTPHGATIMNDGYAAVGRKLPITISFTFD